MTITDIAKRYGLSKDTLRYYERINLIPRVNRTSGGVRNYTEEDCRWIEFIKCMRAAGLSIEVLIEYVSLFMVGDETITKRRELLIQQRDKLIDKMKEMNSTLNRLNHKIERYDNLIVPIENELKSTK